MDLFSFCVSASKKPADTEIASVLAANYLAEMPALFHKYERDRIQRLLAMAPKRQSERLQRHQTSAAATTGPEQQPQGQWALEDSNGACGRDG
jgi:hypothetical protein